MYTDEDLSDDNDINYLESDSEPYLLIYGSSEAEYIRRLHLDRAEVRNGERAAKDLERWKEGVAYYRIRRFFATVEGYYVVIQSVFRGCHCRLLL